MINTRLDNLRTHLKNHGLDAVIFPSNDPHQSEYVADQWKIREYFSGFTGSAGTLVVTKTEAALWTDSRYFLQVEMECADSDVALHKQTVPHAPEHIPWLCEVLPKGSTIGIDFRLFSYGQIEHIEQHAKPKGIILKDILNLVDDLWEGRPPAPNAPIVNHPEIYCGETRDAKIDKVRKDIIEKSADYCLISSLDEIAWLFNIRSSDVDYTPLVTAYALVGRKESYLFVEPSRLTSELTFDLSQAGVKVHPYTGTFSFLNQLSKDIVVLTDASSLNYACYSAIQGSIIYNPSLVSHLKSIKNSVEISNAKDGMLKDGIALTRFFKWLEEYLENNTISEYDLGIKLESFRKEQALYTGQSFGCIVGYKGNGAIIHYSAPEKGSAIISKEGMLLIDSGAQYKNATTDITRTIWLGGTPSDEEKKAYTLVLKGYIELEQLRFPKGTVGMQIDAFARMHLWKHGLNYGHGTGHGIGMYSMVHEPGQGFAATATTSRGSKVHEENQLTTIEPGFYKSGAFGIRTENIVLSEIIEATEFGTFIGFKPLTLCYIDTQLLDDALLSQRDRDWINNYHQHVFASLSGYLNEEESAWLAQKCKSI